jgi:hypothetical protein
MASKLFLVAAVLGLMAVMALADSGPCKGGFWPDGNGCCPQIIKGSPYYRDSNNKCYPKEIKYGVYYADSNGYRLPHCLAHTHARPNVECGIDDGADDDGDDDQVLSG